MELINTAFGFYDQFLTSIPAAYAGLLSLFILLFLAYSIYNFVKGNIVWLIAVVIFVPASIPAIKIILKILLIIFDFLLAKIKL